MRRARARTHTHTHTNQHTSIYVCTFSGWRNVANLCFHGHPSAECTASKKDAMAPMADESLQVPSGGSPPTLLKNGAPLHGKAAGTDRFASVVRFRRSGASGSGGQELRMHTRNGAPVFEKSPFSGGSPGAANRYTLFLVVRTTQVDGDDGNLGVLDLGQEGMRIYQRAVECEVTKGGGGVGTPCNGQNRCGRCKRDAYKTLSTYSMGYAAATDDNSCAALCVSGCQADAVPNECGTRPGGGLHYAAWEWNVLALRADGAEIRGYVNGRHTDNPPPLFLSGFTPATINHFRLGVAGTGPGGADEHGNVDVAEVLVYDEALTVQEMDRVGHYLATKFVVAGGGRGDLGGFELDADTGSASRSLAVSKGCGCDSRSRTGAGGCSDTDFPYCVGGGGAAGSCNADTFRMHVQVESAGGKLDTKGGDWFQVKGVFVLPSDVSVSGPPGLLGGPVGAGGVGVNISDKDLNLTAQFLAVSFLHASRRCTPGPHDHSFTMVREGKDPSFCAVFGAEAQVDVKRTLCGSHVTVLASVVSVGFLTMRRRRRCGHQIVTL